MKKRFLASLLSLCLIVGLLPTVALAANSTQNEAVAEILNENGAQVEAFATEDEVAEYLHDSDTGGLNGPYTLRLLSDITIPIQSGGITAIPLNRGGVLDLNGNVLTVTNENPPDDAEVFIGIASISAGTGPCIIKNGTIVVDFVNRPNTSSYAIWRFGGPLELESVEITTASTTSLTAAIIVSNSNDYGKITAKNCIIDPGNSPLFDKYVEGEFDSELDGVTLVSGSYTNLDLSEADYDYICIGAESTSLENPPDGVDDGTTVITSDDTTAIIVKDGKAYTYDTLKDAVAAADKETTILLVKQPEDQEVMIPNGKNPTFKPLDDNMEIEMGKIPVVDESGNKLEITDEGKLEHANVPVTGVTLDKTSLSLTAGDTATLTATVAPENATNKAVTWRSDNDAVATVDSNGKVTAVSSGTATITATAGGKEAACTVYVTTYSSGGGSSDNDAPTYSITLSKNVTGGEVKPNRRYAEEGETVTVTVDPDKGYELDELVVTDRKGNELKLTDKGNGKFTFKMPASRVEIEVSFKQINAEPEVPAFADVPADAYYADAVAWAVKEGITSGTSATTFSPNASCTRAQMVTFLWRANGSPKATGVNPFADVSADAYYYDAVLWAAEKGITAGTSATTFSPDAVLTRGQTVTFLWRANGSPAVSGSSFGDVAADAYYANAVAWAVSEGITSGTGGNNFSPDAPCTRAQIVTFMYRAD